MFGQLINDWRYRRACEAAAESDLETAIDLYAKLARATDRDFAMPGLLGLTQIRIAVGEYDKAEESLGELEALVAQSEEDQVTRQFRAAVHLDRSHLLRARRKFEAALAAAQKAVDIDRNYYSLLILAWMKKHNGQIEDAIAILTDLLKDGSDTSLVKQCLIGYLFLADQHEQALAIQMTLTPSNDPDFVMNQAWVHACADNVEECLQAMRNAMRAGDVRCMRTFFEMDVEFDRFRKLPEFRDALHGAE